MKKLFNLYLNFLVVICSISLLIIWFIAFFYCNQLYQLLIVLFLFPIPCIVLNEAKNFLERGE